MEYSDPILAAQEVIADVVMERQPSPTAKGNHDVVKPGVGSMEDRTAEWRLKFTDYYAGQNNGVHVENTGNSHNYRVRRVAKVSGSAALKSIEGTLKALDGLGKVNGKLLNKLPPKIAATVFTAEMLSGYIVFQKLGHAF